MIDKLTMKEAIDYLGVTQTAFYRLRAEGLISDGIQQRSNTRKVWSKKNLDNYLKKSSGSIAKPIESGALAAANNAFNLSIRKR